MGGKYFIIQKYNNNPAKSADVYHKIGLFPTVIFITKLFNKNIVSIFDISLKCIVFNKQPIIHNNIENIITGDNLIYFFNMKSLILVIGLNVYTRKKPAIMKKPSTQLLEWPIADFIV